MVIEFNHKTQGNAKQIWSIFQASYAIEAKILKAIDFPPLKRTVSDFVNSHTKFYAYYQDKDLCGMIEIKDDNNSTHIQSLVVYPEYFRKGIAKKLISFILSKRASLIFTVETGLNNIPAIKLYRSMGFKQTRQWDTDHGVRKVAFALRS